MSRLGRRGTDQYADRLALSQTGDPRRPDAAPIESVDEATVIERTQPAVPRRNASRLALSPSCRRFHASDQAVM